ncbi:MAG TPA: hypothetical protein VNN20_02075 [Thermodesulfobacteriota bacterium]|nr:hypothetical protein [Thermodesulfobacteriota bacterium]
MGKNKKSKHVRKPVSPEAELTPNQERVGRIKSILNHKGFVAIFLFFVSFLVFLPSLKNGFVWDDVVVIQQNYNAFKRFHPSSLLIPKDRKVKRVGYFRPMVYTSMYVDRNVWGLSPFGFHLSNLVFNSTATVLFYFMALLLLKEFGVERKESIAFLSSLLFAFHPMHVESVSWVAGRTDVLCGLFFFLAFIFYMLSYRKLGFLVLVILSLVLSLFSKEVAVAFPVAALAFDLVSGRYKSRVNLLKYALCLILVFAFVYLRGRGFVTIPQISAGRIQDTVDHGFHYWGVLKILLNSYAFYIKELVFPFDFNAFIGKVPGGFKYLFSSVLIFFLSGVASYISIKRKKGLIAFSLLWIFITIAPSLIIAVSFIAATPLAERYLYVPSAGYCMLLGYLIFLGGKWFKDQRVVWVISTVILLSYLFYTVDRQSVWRDNLSLWEDATKSSPDEFLPHLNYGAALQEAGKLDEALGEYILALNAKESNNRRQKARASSNIGIVYGIKGDLVNAERWFIKAINLDPSYWRSYYHLGVIYVIRGDNGDPSAYKKAEQYLQRTVRIYPKFGRAYLVLAKLYMRFGERDKARENAQKALRTSLSEPMVKDAQFILKITN